jgi:hypothetical protein
MLRPGLPPARAPRKDRPARSATWSMLLTYVAVHPSPADSFSLADDVNQNNRPDLDLVPLFGPPTFRGKQGF